MPLAPRHVASRRFRVSGKRAMINSSHPKKPMSIIIEAGIQFIYIIYFMDGPGYGWSWFWCPSGFRIEKLSVSGCVPPLRRTACSQGLLRYLIGCVNGLGKTKYGILKVDGQKPKLLTSWGEEHKNSMVSNLGFKPRFQTSFSGFPYSNCRTHCWSSPAHLPSAHCLASWVVWDLPGESMVRYVRLFWWLFKGKL